MAKGVANFSGKRLTEARLARGLFKNVLGDMIGVSSAAIGRYEADQDKPHPERLEDLASKLSFPIEFFTRPPWPEKIEPIFWRHKAAETKAAREMTEQRMRWLCEIFDVLEQEIEFPDLNVPKLDLPEDFRLISSSMIEEYAEQVRSFWRLRELPIRDMILCVESAGVPVVMLDIPSEKQDGFFFSSQSLHRPFIGVNIHDVTSARARFDVAHELGHLCLHRMVTAEQERNQVSHKILEQQAHRFAGAFLFPRAAFLNEVGVPSLDYFSALKKRWGISIAAMIARSYDLGMIDSDMKTYLYISMSKRKWRGRRREPFDDTMALERPRMLRRGIDALLGAGDYSTQDIRSILCLPPSEIEGILSLSSGSLSAGILSKIDHIARKRAPVTAEDLETGNVITFPGRHVRT